MKIAVIIIIVIFIVLMIFKISNSFNFFNKIQTFLCVYFKLQEEDLFVSETYRKIKRNVLLLNRKNYVYNVINIIYDMKKFEKYKMDIKDLKNFYLALSIIY